MFISQIFSVLQTQCGIEIRLYGQHLEVFSSFNRYSSNKSSTQTRPWEANIMSDIAPLIKHFALESQMQLPFKVFNIKAVLVVKDGSWRFECIIMLLMFS